MTAWVTGLGQQFRIGASGATNGISSGAGGVAVGGDVRLTPEILLGVAAGYTSGRVTSRGTGATADLDRFHLTAYGSYLANGFYVDAQVGGAFGEDDVRRNQGVFGTSTRSKPSVSGFAGGAEGGMVLALGGWRVMPGVGLRVDQQSRDAVTESGAGAVNQHIDDGRLHPRGGGGGGLPLAPRLGGEIGKALGRGRGEISVGAA